MVTFPQRAVDATVSPRRFLPEMTEPREGIDDTFKRRFLLGEFGNVCVLHLAEDFSPDDSDALCVFNAGVDSLVRAGIRGFVFDLTHFSHRADVDESLGDLVRLMVPVIRNHGVLNWLHGAMFVREWKTLNLLGLPPENFETQQEAVEGLQMVLQAAHVRTHLAHTIA
jgi:hypothetical protein